MTDSRLLVEPADLRSTFRELLAEASEVRLAAAWARSGWAIDELSRCKVDVQSVIGTSFGMTRPEALRRLARLGALWIAPDDDGELFHPKVYLFRTRGGWRAIIGSPNLTKAAFHSNREAAVMQRLSDAEAKTWVGAWDEWRDRGTRATREWLDCFEASYRQPRTGPLARLAKTEDMAGHHRPRNDADLTLADLLGADWGEYERRLEFAAKEVLKGDDALGEGPSSYRATLRTMRQITRGPFPEPGSADLARLMGRNPTPEEVSCGWLGTLQGTGRGIEHFNKNDRLRKDLQRLLPRLRKARSDLAVLAAGKAVVEAITHWDGLSMGSATRLLTVYRPDRFFSLNTASVTGIANLIGMRKSRLTTWEGYSEVLKRLWSTPWFQDSPPAKVGSRELWDARVALIDVFVYEPRKR